MGRLGVSVRVVLVLVLGCVVLVLVLVMGVGRGPVLQPTSGRAEQLRLMSALERRTWEMGSEHAVCVARHKDAHGACSG